MRTSYRKTGNQSEIFDENKTITAVTPGVTVDQQIIVLSFIQIWNANLQLKMWVDDYCFFLRQVT